MSEMSLSTKEVVSLMVLISLFKFFLISNSFFKFLTSLIEFLKSLISESSVISFNEDLNSLDIFLIDFYNFAI